MSMSAGIGKSYLSESLGNKACRLGYRVLLIRVPRLFHSLALARSTGRLLAFFKTLATQDVLILEDLCLSVNRKRKIPTAMSKSAALSLPCEWARQL
ncbi:MAG: ATP-binding protein [Leptospirillum sp.]